MISMGEIFS